MTNKTFGASVGDWTPPPAPQIAALDGHWVRLEKLSADQHSEALFQANTADDQIWDYLPYGPFDDVSSYASWVTSVEHAPDPYFFAVLPRKTGLAEGVMSFLRVKPESGSIEVGHINLSPALQRTPAATEAIYLLMNWGFDAGYRRFEWKCDALNIASRRAAQRFGLSFEGVFRNATVYKGRNRDTAWFAAIDTDWPALKSAFETWLAPSNFSPDGSQKSTLSDGTNTALVATDPALR